MLMNTQGRRYSLQGYRIPHVQDTSYKSKANFLIRIFDLFFSFRNQRAKKSVSAISQV